MADEAGFAGLHIGPRLRDARLRQGLTVDQVAELTNLSKGFVSRLERDRTSPSVATLVAICEVLTLPIGEPFAAPTPDVVRQRDAPQVQLVGVGVDERLLTPRNQPRLQLVRSMVDPLAGGGPDLYTLNAEVEVLHVLKGQVVVVFTGRTELLRAGDSITFSGREPHTWHNPSPTRTAEVLWVIAPSTWSSVS